MTESTERTPSGWQLSPLQIPTLRRPIEISLSGLSVGRDPSNSLPLPTDHFPGVSGHHARFFFEGEDLWIEDMGSKNGTIVLGERIEKKKLTNGDVLQFGSGGPRFAVLSAAGLEGTVSLARTAFFGARPKSSIGEETVEKVRAQLDLPDKVEVAKMIAGGERKNRTAIIMTVLVLVGLSVFGWDTLEENKESVEQLKDDTTVISKKLASSKSQLEEHEGILETQQREYAEVSASWESARESWESERKSWESHRSSLMKQRETLESTIKNLADNKETTNVDLDALRTQLEETTRNLSLYDPVNLEQARLREVARINRAVVMIEAKEVLRNKKTQKILYISDGRGSTGFNFDGVGEPLSKEASGSGFCLSEEGYVLTNAHVVFKEEQEDQSFLDLAKELDFEAILELTVTFSGESTKHKAVLVSHVRDLNNDLALLMIEEKLENIPTVGKLSLATPEPSGGTEVFCIGFPLGRTVMQQGETVIASTFRGIVSRKVQAYLQVDAAIHPGASGGPVIDGAGNVVGIVTAIHPVDREGKASAIGYIIPIASAEVLWPFD